MSEGATKTDDKTVAMMILERCLESKKPLNVGIENLDGVYTIEVSTPIDRVGKPEADC